MEVRKPMRKTIQDFCSACALVGVLLLMITVTNAQQPAPTRDVHARVTETVIDSSIPDDTAVDKMLAAYSPKVHELDVRLGKLKGELRKGGIGAGSLGNFVAD